MKVAFRRTGQRRYGVILAVSGKPLQTMHPAPGYDDDIPHDLVHYIVEAELGLTSGVFGRAALGAGTFVEMGGADRSPRERARQRRKQARRERSLSRRDRTDASEMAASERLAALCDVAFRRRHGQAPDPLRKAPEPCAPSEAALVERVLARLDRLAPLWRALPVGGELVFTWPGMEATPVPPDF